MTETGRKQVRAIISQGVALAERQATLAQLRKPVADPPIGSPREGIEPGAWGLNDEQGVPMPDEMPPDCPVRVLGYNGGDLWLLDAAGQVRCLEGSKQIGQGTIEALFMDRIAYAYWAWPRFTKAPKGGGKPKVDNFRAERARQSFWGEAGRLNQAFDGLDAIRGRGVWLGEQGQLVVHCGDCLFVDGKVLPPGEYGSYVYPRMAPILHPWAGPVNGDAAETVLELYNHFSWGRPKVDALLALGWDGVAMVSGAMRVRPSILVTGDKGRGKTTFQDIKKVIFDKYLLSTTNTTPAGIYQKVNQDARPIGIDELENSGDNTLAIRIVELARQSYSGGVMLRGGSNHNGVEFECRSSFLLSMINPPPLPPQDLSRLGILVLRRPPENDRGPPPVLTDEDVGAKFMRRMMDGWAGYDQLFARYRTALLKGGHEERGCDTYGTLLTCAHILLGDESLRRFGYPVEDLSKWGEWLSVASMPELEDQGATWLRCLNMLFTRSIDIWRGGGQMTVGAVIEHFEGDKDGSLPQVNNKLGQVGLRLLSPKEFRWPEGRRPCTGYILAIPNTSPQVARIFEGTPWSAGPGGESGWRLPLKDAPDGVLLEDLPNRVTINRAVARCTLVSLSALDAVTGRKAGQAVINGVALAPPSDGMEGFE